MTDATLRDSIVAALSRRLKPLCKDWPEELFQNMVGQMADISLKYEGRASRSSYDRRSVDGLVADLRDALDRSEAMRDKTRDL